MESIQSILPKQVIAIFIRALSRL